MVGVPGFLIPAARSNPLGDGFTCRNAESRQQFHEKRFSLPSAAPVLVRVAPKETPGPRIRWHYNHRVCSRGATKQEDEEEEEGVGRERGRKVPPPKKDHFRGDN